MSVVNPKYWVPVAALVLAMTYVAATSTAPRLQVTGYVESGDGPAAVRPSLAALSTLAVDGVNINAAGSTVGTPDGDSTALLAQAHRAHKRAEFLVGNYSGAIGDFDEAAAYRLLSSPAHRAAVEKRLVASVAGQGWDGVHLDLESLTARDRPGLTSFVTELRRRLPKAKSLSLAVMAATSSGDYAAMGYDLPKLAGPLTRVVLMAYDEHGPGWSGAGPVGGLPWARASAQALLRQVPRDKVDLGVAGYGYTWPAQGDGEQVSDARARSIAVDPVWDATQGEWHAGLAAGGTLWWSDARSLAAREKLATRLGLAGVAVWSLGLSDPIG